MPDVGEKQGPKGDGQQNQGKGDAPCKAKLGGVKFGGLGEGGRNQRKQGRDDLDGFHGFPVWSAAVRAACLLVKRGVWRIFA